MTQAYASYERYVADHQAFEQSLAGGPAWLRDLRAAGFAAFDRAGFPTVVRGNERWKYTNVGPIARATFGYPLEVHTNGAAEPSLNGSLPSDDGWARMVFVDGRFSTGLSGPGGLDNGVSIGNLAESVNGKAELVQEHLGRYASIEEDGFIAINTAFIQDGAFAAVPDGTVVRTPLHIVYLSSQREQPTVSYPRNLVVVGRNSSLTIVESYIGPTGGAYFTDSVTEIVVEEGAQIEHYRYLMESDDAFHVGTTRVRLGRDSAFSSTSIAKGAKLARNDLSVVLDAPGASCTLNGLYVTAGSQHIDNHIDIDHAKHHTTSDQYFKGILTDDSRAVFSGRVLIQRDAQKSNARQADKNLMLSDGARVNTKPSMEIFADDVKAVHGATAGAVAPEALFYMQSRGLDLQTARSLLIYGFAGEIIDKIRLEPLRQHVEQLLTRVLPTFQLEGAA